MNNPTLHVKTFASLHHPLVDAANAFATHAHEGQKRKHTEDPYIIHPRNVADLVCHVNQRAAVVSAALLHDVVEDCNVTFDEIEQEFGFEVCEYVRWLSHSTVLADGNRAVRSQIWRCSLRNAPRPVKVIKACDLIDNTRSLLTAGDAFGGFRAVYLAEIAALAKELMPCIPESLRVELRETYAMATSI